MSDAETWLAGRGKRRVEAVKSAYGILGLDYGEGHLDDLYMQAYDNAFRDTWALMEQCAAQERAAGTGAYDLGHQALTAQAWAEASGRPAAR
jgi:hypothetical protein